MRSTAQPAPMLPHSKPPQSSLPARVGRRCLPPQAAARFDENANGHLNLAETRRLLRACGYKARCPSSPSAPSPLSLPATFGAGRPVSFDPRTSGDAERGAVRSPLRRSPQTSGRRSGADAADAGAPATYSSPPRPAPPPHLTAGQLMAKRAQAPLTPRPRPRAAHPLPSPARPHASLLPPPRPPPRPRLHPPPPPSPQEGTEDFGRDLRKALSRLILLQARSCLDLAPILARSRPDVALISPSSRPDLVPDRPDLAPISP